MEFRDPFKRTHGLNTVGMEWSLCSQLLRLFALNMIQAVMTQKHVPSV